MVPAIYYFRYSLTDCKIEQGSVTYRGDFRKLRSVDSVIRWEIVEIMLPSLLLESPLK